MKDGLRGDNCQVPGNGDQTRNKAMCSGWMDASGRLHALDLKEID